MSKEDELLKDIKFSPHSTLENWILGIPEVYLVKDGKLHPINEELIKDSDCVVFQGKMSTKEILNRFDYILTDKEKELLNLYDDEQDESKHIK